MLRHPLVQRLLVWIRAHPGLTGLLLLGFGLRVTTILWGVQFGYSGRYHPDELKVLQPALDFANFYLTDRPFPMYGTSLQYTLGFFLWPIEALLGGVIPYWTLAWLGCRLVVVALGTATIALTFELGRRLHDERTALAAAALLTLSPLHVLNSAVFTLDVPMGALLVGSVLLCWWLVERGGPLSSYLLLGAATGYLLGTKLTAGVFLVVPATLLALGFWPVVSARAFAVRLGASALAAAVVFTVLNPQYFVAFEKILEYALRERADFMERAAESGRTFVTGVARGAGVALGAPVALLSAAGLLLATADLRRGRSVPRAFALGLVSLVVMYVLIFRHFLLPRYVLFVAPILCIFAATACVRMMGRQQRWVWVAGAACLGAGLLHSAVTAAEGLGARLTDPRIVAARYLAQEHAGPRRIAVSFVSEEYRGAHRWRFPRLVDSRHERVAPYEEPDLLVTSSYAMKRIEQALSSPHLLEDYRWDPEYAAAWYRYSPPSPRLFAFYDRLLRGEAPYLLLRTFEPVFRSELEFPPPVIQVYERVSSGEGSSSDATPTGSASRD